LISDNHSVAFLEYLKYSGKVDKDTGCMKFTWESVGQRYKFVDIKNIVSVEHVLPIFKEGSDKMLDEFLLNKFDY